MRPREFGLKLVGLACAALVGCGARSSLLGSSASGEGGAPTSTTSSTAASSSAASGGAEGCSARGVRVCGGDCPTLDTASCPGFGCAPTLDVTNEQPTAYGVCWSDLPDGGMTPCNACPDDSGCLERNSGELICVPLEVCAALWALGGRTVCRYADKSAYDHRALTEPAGVCPVGPVEGDAVACGGACPSCAIEGLPPYLQACSDQSPNHPFGICVHALANGAPCSLSPQGGYAVPCAFGEGACGVYQDDAADQPVARVYGTCVPMGTCKAIAAALPGGFLCFDKHGMQAAP